MDITYLGHSSFKLKGKSQSLITDPFNPKMVGLKFTKNDADIVTISHQHEDHNDISMIDGVRKVVEGPGEYEIGGVSIIGISSYHDNEKGALRGKNTIFVIEMDGIRLVHLGDLGHVLDKDKLTAIGVVDILFIPVGGEYTIGPKDAFEVVQALTPKIIIPMHYKVEGVSLQFAEKLLSVDDFLTLSSLKVEKSAKFSIKSDMLSTEDQFVVVMDKK